jgi:DNA-binding beta-propeller fold protein YncE
VDLEVRTLIFSASNFVRRRALFSLLAAMAAGCSATNAPGLAPGATTTQTSLQRQSAAMEHKLADGFVHRASAANRAHGWMSPDAKHSKDLFYWGDFVSNTIYVYKKNGVNPKEVGTITDAIDEPERLFVDGSKNLWVTDLGNDTVTEYARGATSPSFTISTGIANPTGIVVDSAGTVYVANVDNSTVTEYPKGESSPSLTISMTASPEYLATDSSDNLYVSTGLGVWEFPAGSTTGTELNLTIGSPGAIEVDDSGNIILADDGPALAVDVFPPGVSTPSKSIPVGNDPFALSLSKSEKKLYVSGENTSNGSFLIEQLDYPNGTTFTDKLTTGTGDWPIAVSPDNVL